jgi:hypothetical protein
MNDFSFQEEAANRHFAILSKHNFTFDGCGTGKGKTFIASKLIAKLPYTHIGVVCPKSVIGKWASVLRTEAPDKKYIFILNPEQLKTGRTKWCKKWIKQQGRKKNHIFKWELPPSTFVCIDELHEYSNPTTQNNALFKALSDYPVIGLSATLTNTPLKLMGAVGERLGLHKGYDSWNWCTSMGCSPSFWGQGKALEFSKDPEIQQLVMRRLHDHIYPERGHRLPDDFKIGNEYPAYIEAACLDFGDSFSPEVEEALEQVDTMEEDDILRAEESGNGGSHLSARIREQMREELMKCDWLAEKAQSIVEEGGSFIAFVNFQITVRTLQTILKQIKGLPQAGPYIGTYSGDDPAKYRESMLGYFQRNEIKILICTIGAGSSSIDLHDTIGNSPRHSFIAPSDNPVKLLQALGRADRLNRKSAVVQTLIYSVKGVESQIYQNVMKKLDCIETLNSGDIDREKQK